MPDFESALKAYSAIVIISGFISVGFSVLVLLILRPFWCWYFKINDVTILLTEIRDLLYNQQDSENSRIKHSSLSPDNPRDSAPLSAVIIQEETKVNSRFEAKINPQADSTKTEKKSFWNVDKPMLSPSDKKWQPPEAKK